MIEQRLGMRTRIKICGITDSESAAAAVEAGADAIGLMFVEHSPRCISAEHAKHIVQYVLPPFVNAIAVFQNPSADDDPNVTTWPGSWVQMHGDEDAEFLNGLPHHVIKACPFEPDAVRMWATNDAVDALLVDGPRGGSGDSFDHERLAEMMPEIQKPVILAGGLTPDNVGEAIRTIRPFAVDVSSGVEHTRGVKDPAAIDAFCRAVRAADQSMLE